MTVGFGAAGWQYYQSLATSDPGSAATELSSETTGTAPSQDWLITPTGGLVGREVALSYLRQERFVPNRTVTLSRSARLTDLLAKGEKLPEAPYLQVLADIRAPMVAKDLCAVMTGTIASHCAVNAARVEEDSVDPVAGTARFTVELVYRLKPEDVALPDLATRILAEDRILVQLEAGIEGTASAEAALATAIDDASAACAEKPVEKLCRIMRIRVDWAPGADARLAADIAWLDPLPEGVFPAPPLEPATGN